MTREQIARILCERRNVPVGSCTWDAYLADADAILALSPPEPTEGHKYEAIVARIDAAIDYHDVQASEADGFDCAESARWHDSQRKLLMALKAQAAPLSLQDHGWQDISTAPKDGSTFLAFFLGEAVVAKWSDFLQEHVGLSVKWYNGEQTVQSFRDGWGRGGATHWRSLPAAPAMVAEDGISEVKK